MRILCSLLFAAICLVVTALNARSAETIVSTYNDALVWASPAATASGSTESVTLSPAVNLVPPIVKVSDWGFAPRDLSADSVALESDGSGRFTVGKADGNEWHYQVGHNGIALAEGKSYTVSFRAKADVARTISVHTQAFGGDWHAVGLDADVPLTTTWQTMKFNFVAKNVTDNAQLVFNIGQQNGTVWLNDLALVAQTDTSTPPEQTSALKISVTGKAGAMDVQALSKPFTLTDGQTYLLSFKARADAPREANLVVRINSNDYHAVSDFNTSIGFGTDWHTYNFPFTANKSEAGNTVIAFAVGDQTGNLWIADLTLTHTGTGVIHKTELPVVPPPPNVPIPAHAYRVLFVGNSITQHGFDAGTIQDLGWDHLSGMAASNQTNDYVHLFIAKLQAVMPNRPIAIRITSLIPGGLGSTQERIAPVVRDAAGYAANLVVIQHGEHELQPRGVDLLKETYSALLDIFDKAAPRPKIVCVGNWSTDVKLDRSDYQNWSADVEHAMAAICADRGIPFVPVSTIAADPLNHGYGTNPGVQWHPNDRAHALYADRIFEALRPVLIQAGMIQASTIAKKAS